MRINDKVATPFLFLLGVRQRKFVARNLRVPAAMKESCGAVVRDRPTTIAFALFTATLLPFHVFNGVIVLSRVLDSSVGGEAPLIAAV